MQSPRFDDVKVGDKLPALALPAINLVSSALARRASCCCFRVWGVSLLFPLSCSCPRRQPRAPLSPRATRVSGSHSSSLRD